MITDPNQTLTEESDRFVQIPEWILLHPQLPAPAVRLYGVLKMYARRSERAWPGRATLAGHLGCSEDSIDRYVKALRDVGAVKTTARWQAADRPAFGAAPIFLEPGLGRIQTSSIYHLVWTEPKVSNGAGLAAAQVQGGGRKDAGTGGRKDAGTVAAPVRPEVHALEPHAPEAQEARAREPQNDAATERRRLVREQAMMLAHDLILTHEGKITVPSSTLGALFIPAIENGVTTARLRSAVSMILRDGKQLAQWTLQEYAAKAAAASASACW